MKTSSAKSKGRNHQKAIVQDILNIFTDLEADDVQWRSMGSQGEDIMLSPKARKLMPISIEAKCQESLNFWAAYEQAQSNANRYIPVVIAKRNRTKPLVLLDWTHFLWLLNKASDNGPLGTPLLP